MIVRHARRGREKGPPWHKVKSIIPSHQVWDSSIELTQERDDGPHSESDEPSYRPSGVDSFHHLTAKKLPFSVQKMGVSWNLCAQIGAVHPRALLTRGNAHFPLTKVNEARTPAPKAPKIRRSQGNHAIGRLLPSIWRCESALDACALPTLFCLSLSLSHCD